MMRRTRSLGSVVGLILITWVGLAAVRPTPISQVHMPLVVNDAVGCANCDRGIAWAINGCASVDHLHRLLAHYFYASGTQNCASSDGAVVIVRATNPPFYEDVLAVIGTGYDGDILVMNEPDLLNQDHMTEEEAVAFTMLVRQTWPDAFLIGPNNSHDLGSGWLVGYLTLLPDGVLDAYSFHIYGTDITVHERVDLFCQKVIEAGKACDLPIWITEMGYSLNWPDPQTSMEALARQARQDARVDVVFAYTSRDECCPEWNLLNLDDTLTLTGQGWVEATFSTGLEAAYPAPLRAYP